MMIDIDKFVASVMDSTSGLTQHVCHCDLLNALKAQGLEYKNGEIIKTQRRVAAEAKEALYTAEVETGDGGIKAVVTKEISVKSEDEMIRKTIINALNRDKSLTEDEAYDCVAWLEKQGEKKISNWDEKDSSMQFTLMRDIDQVSFISPEGKAERIKWLNSLDDRFVTKGKESV